MTKELPTIPPERADDLHHLQYADAADLVLFMAGNQFMVMQELLSTVSAQSPDADRAKGKPGKHKVRL